MHFGYVSTAQKSLDIRNSLGHFVPSTLLSHVYRLVAVRNKTWAGQALEPNMATESNTGSASPDRAQSQRLFGGRGGSHASTDVQETEPHTQPSGELTQPSVSTRTQNHRTTATRPPWGDWRSFFSAFCKHARSGGHPCPANSGEPLA